MVYQRKTRDTFELHVNYGYGDGWEHELTEYTRREINERKKEYLQNCPQYPVKVVKRRERIVGGSV